MERGKPGLMAVVGRTAWAAMVVGLGLAVFGPAARGASGDESRPPKAEAELSSLRDFLIGPDRTLATRRDAAEVLLNETTSAARAILLEVLAGPTPSEATLAVLDALASHQSAPDVLVDSLFQLLRRDDETTRRAAALAFGVYQGKERVLARLREMVLAAETPPGVRAAAVRALAQIIDRRSIETLMQLVSDPKDPVAAAAAAALVDMTGLEDLGTSREAWVEWWKQHEGDSDAILLGTLLRKNREKIRQRDAALERLQTRLVDYLKATYEAADAKEKRRLVLLHLEDAVPQVRTVGAQQAALIAQAALGAGNGTGRQTDPDLLAALLKHVTDESPKVRAAAAEALAAWKETSVGPVLLARMDQEKAPDVRAALAAAMGALKVVEAVPALVAMLDSHNETEVVRAAGALGLIGEKDSPGAASVEPAIQPLGRLARLSPQPSIREAAALALAKMAPPSAEGVLVDVLEDATASVRFAAAQGLGNLAKAGDKTVQALVAHLQDENKGVRQAVAGALAKLGDPEAARKMADRLKAGAEPDPAVRNALWAAIQSLIDHSGSPDLAVELGDRFFAREGTEEMQRAAAMYEAALVKLPPATRTDTVAQGLYEKLVDAYLAAGMPESAVPALRQLLVVTPPEHAARLRELNQQLGLILLAKEPYGDAVPPLVAAMEGAGLEVRLALAKAVQSRAETLLAADRPDQAMELLGAFRRARPDWGRADVARTLEQLADRATDTTIDQAVEKLGGADKEAAVAMLKKIGRPATARLFEALEAAAKDRQTAREAELVAALEILTNNRDHGYDSQAPLANRLKRLAAWRQKS
jgi:HEAT repeat protein